MGPAGRVDALMVAWLLADVMRGNAPTLAGTAPRDAIASRDMRDGLLVSRQSRVSGKTPRATVSRAVYADRTNARKILVGRAIVHGRNLLELTQGQLARQLGIDPRQLSEWERGIHEPGDRHLASLMGALGQPLAFFYTEHGERECAA